MTTTSEREQEIRAALKRCSSETVSAALRFPDTHGAEDLAIIIHGVLLRDLPDTHGQALETATDSTRLIDDLGMDSFGMMEVVMTAEEVFGITIPNQELRDITTLGALRTYLLSKVKGTHEADAVAAAADLQPT
jgi:acyl carrier protein